MPTLFLLRNYNLSDEEVKKLPTGSRGVFMESGKSTVIARADIPLYMPLTDVVSLTGAMSRAIPNAQIGYSERTLPKSQMITTPIASWKIDLSDQQPKNHKSSAKLETFPSEEIHLSDEGTKKQKMGSKYRESKKRKQDDIEDAVFNSDAVQDVTATELKQYPMDVVEVDGTDIIDAEIVDEDKVHNADGFVDLEKETSKPATGNNPKMTWWEMLDAGLARQAYDKIISSQLSIEEKGKLQFYFTNKDPNILICLCRVAIALDVKSLVMPISRKCFIHEHPQVRKEAVLAVGKLSGPSMESALVRMQRDTDEDVQKATPQGARSSSGLVCTRTARWCLVGRFLVP